MRYNNASAIKCIPFHFLIHENILTIPHVMIDFVYFGEAFSGENVAVTETGGSHWEQRLDYTVGEYDDSNPNLRSSQRSI